MIYLNTHWQSQLDSAAVRETIPLAEPPIKDFTDVKIDCIKNKNKIQHFFMFIFIFFMFLCQSLAAFNFPIILIAISAFSVRGFSL